MSMQMKMRNGLVTSNGGKSFQTIKNVPNKPKSESESELKSESQLKFESQLKPEQELELKQKYKMKEENGLPYRQVLHIMNSDSDSDFYSDSDLYKQKQQKAFENIKNHQQNQKEDEKEPREMELMASVLNKSQTEALKREVLRLTRANNALNVQIIQEAEKAEMAQREVAKMQRRSSSKTQDLEFVCAQRTRQLQVAEKTITELQQKVENSLRDRGVYARESKESIGVVPSSQESDSIDNTLAASAAEHIEQVQIVESLQKKASHLEEELATAREDLTNASERQQVLQQRVKARDAEIQRLSSILSNDRNWDRVQVEAELRSQSKTIRTLNEQLDLLNDERMKQEENLREARSMVNVKQWATLQKQVDDAISQRDRLLAETEELRSKMQSMQASNIDQMSNQSSHNRELLHLRNELASRDSELEQALRNLDMAKQREAQMQSNLDKALNDNDQIKAQRAALENDLSKLHKASLKTVEERAKYAHEQQLASIQAKLEHQQILNKGLQERTDELQKFLTMKEEAVLSHTRTISTLQNQLQDEQMRSSSLSIQIDTLKNQLSDERLQRDSLANFIRDLDAKVLNMQTEVTAVVKERELLRAELDTQKQQATSSTAVERSMNEQIELHRDSFSTLRNEKQQLELQIVELQQQMQANMSSIYMKDQRCADLNKEIADLHSQIDKLLLEKREEHDRAYLAENRSVFAQKQIGSLQQQLERELDRCRTLETRNAELQKNIEQLKQLCEEMDGARAKIETELQHAVHKNQAHAQFTLETAALKSDSEAAIVALQKQLADMHASQRSSDKRYDDTQHDLAMKQKELDHARQLLEAANSQHQDMSSTIGVLKQDLAVAKDKLHALTAQLDHSHTIIAELQQRAVRAEDTAALKSNEMRVVLDDLGSMLKENQRLNSSLAESHGQLDAKTMELESVLSRFSQTKDSLLLKEREVQDLLTNYRAICQDNERSKSTIQQLDSERSELRSHVRVLQEEVQRLEGFIQSLEHEKQRRAIDLASMERGISELSRDLQNLQEQLRQSRAEKEALLKDVNAARSISVGLEHNRDAMSRQQLELQQTITKLNMQISGLKLENERLNSSLKAAHNHQESLESVIMALRSQISRYDQQLLKK